MHIEFHVDDISTWGLTGKLAICITVVALVTVVSLVAFESAI